MACRLFSPRPLSKPLVVSHQSHPREYTSEKNWPIFIGKLHMKLSFAILPLYWPGWDELDELHWISTHWGQEKMTAPHKGAVMWRAFPCQVVIIHVYYVVACPSRALVVLNRMLTIFACYVLTFMFGMLFLLLTTSLGCFCPRILLFE